MDRITTRSTTEEVLSALGERLRGYRLQQNLTQREVARDAGIGLRTLQRAEDGANPELGTFVQVLRALGRLEELDVFLAPPLISPLRVMEIAAGRQRARTAARGAGA